MTTTTMISSGFQKHSNHICERILLITEPEPEDIMKMNSKSINLSNLCYTLAANKVYVKLMCKK